jgi:hypothetical protein
LGLPGCGRGRKQDYLVGEGMWFNAVRFVGFFSSFFVFSPLRFLLPLLGALWGSNDTAVRNKKKGPQSAF